MPLTPLQRRVAELALGLPEAASFCLVGGGAMLAHGLVDRPTDDLDLFTTTTADVARLAAAVADALVARDFTVTTEREFETFVRLVVARGDEAIRVDIARDVRIRPPVRLEIGPVADVEELGADKVLALFGRAEPRDLVDLVTLLDHVERTHLLDLAREKDPGFLPSVFRDALRAAAGAPDERYHLLGVGEDQLAELRSRALAWADELTKQSGA